MRRPTEDLEATVGNETSHLLCIAANAERLITSIERARRAEFEDRDLVDL